MNQCACDCISQETVQKKLEQVYTDQSVQERHNPKKPKYMAPVRSCSGTSVNNILEIFKFWFNWFSFQKGNVVIGKCGGRCGMCKPDSEMGLKVVISEGRYVLFETNLFSEQFSSKTNKQTNK